LLFYQVQIVFLQDEQTFYAEQDEQEGNCFCLSEKQQKY